MIAGRITAALVIVLLLICQALAAAGLRYNTSPSVAVGLYWINSRSRTPQVGDYVAFCLPESELQQEAKRRNYLRTGSCVGDTSPLLKILAAGPGDSVELTTSGVVINGDLWPSSEARTKDALGRPLLRHRGRYTLAPGQFLMLSAGNGDGFDGRYFGPVPQESVLGAAVRIL